MDPEKLAEYRDAGYSRVLFIVLPVKGQDMIGMLDAYAEAAQKVG